MQKEAKIGSRCWLNCYIILVLSDLLKDLVLQKNLLDKDIWKEESRGTVPNKKVIVMLLNNHLLDLQKKPSAVIG